MRTGHLFTGSQDMLEGVSLIQWKQFTWGGGHSRDRPLGGVSPAVSGGTLEVPNDMLTNRDAETGLSELRAVGDDKYIPGLCPRLPGAQLRKSQGSLVSSVCQEVMAMGSVRTRAGARRTSRRHLGGERA